MAQRTVMLAVAGAGKTYFICNNIDPNKKNLILAYTRENVRIIKDELVEAFDKIPEMTSVLTFDAFIYRFLLRPYEPSIFRYFNRVGFRNNGITMRDPPPQRIDVKIKGQKRNIANPKYKGKDCFEHYVDAKGQYYCANLSELIMEVKENRVKLIQKAGQMINQFFDQIMIDEFQDYREHDYDLIIGLSKSLDNALFVGDFYQHSVSATNNSGKPFSLRTKKGGKRVISYDEYKDTLKKAKFDVDEVTLNRTRRCSKQVCEFVREKLGIPISSYDNHESEVIWVNDFPNEILEDDSILKLVEKNANAYRFSSFNWSYSKGITREKVCVILTKNLERLCEDDFDYSSIAPVTLNKLYVALTRAKGDLYIMRESVFSAVKDSYLIKE